MTNLEAFMEIFKVKGTPTVEFWTKEFEGELPKEKKKTTKKDK